MINTTANAFDMGLNSDQRIDLSGLIDDGSAQQNQHQ